MYGDANHRYDVELVGPDGADRGVAGVRAEPILALVDSNGLKTVPVQQRASDHCI